MTVPEWWVFVLLSLASFRIWRLLAVDTITDPLRKRLFRWKLYDEGKDGYRFTLDEFVACPWCFGFWICGLVLAVYCVVFGWMGVVSFGAVWLALSTVVGFLAKGDS